MAKALNYVNHFSLNAPARSKLKSFYFWGRDLKTHLLSCSIILRYCSYNLTHICSPLQVIVIGSVRQKNDSKWFGASIHT